MHRFVNDLERDVGTYLYGRRMYETMAYWEAAHLLDDQPAHIREYAQIWQAERSSTRGRSRHRPAQGPASSTSSIPMRSAG